MIRVRFAPSPTGHLHIGGLRTALFNWLFARHNNGTFLLRIEDTDVERSKKEYLDSIMQSLNWVGINSDEPEVIQSELIASHLKVAQKLIDEKKAYKCYCSQDDLEKRIGAGAGLDAYTKYDKLCRLSENSKNKDLPFVIRYKLPDDIDEISFEDLIWGKLTFPIDQFDDFIIVRSDGVPVYNFVVVIDDHNMKISHVLRGEDHITNTPKQILLYKACGFELPKFGHFPNILGPSGAKLSKRDGATAVIDYKYQGFLPTALCNYLVRLGWSYNDQEIFTQNELISLFSLENIGRKGSIFDIKKLEWVNTVFLKEMSSENLFNYIKNEMQIDLVKTFPDYSQEQILKALTIYKNRSKNIKEIIEELNLLFNQHINYNFQQSSNTKEVIINVTTQLIDNLEKLEKFDLESISVYLKEVAKNLNLEFFVIGKLLRFAIIGQESSPNIFELLSILGKQKVINRLKNLLEACF